MFKVAEEVKKETASTKQELKEKLWYDMKKIKKGFQPNNTKIRDKEGKPVPSTKKAETLADYFEKIQWGNNKKLGKTKTKISKIRLTYIICLNINFSLNTLL